MAGFEEGATQTFFHQGQRGLSLHYEGLLALPYLELFGFVEVVAVFVLVYAVLVYAVLVCAALVVFDLVLFLLVIFDLVNADLAVLNLAFDYQGAVAGQLLHFSVLPYVVGMIAARLAEFGFAWCHTSAVDEVVRHA